MVNIFEKAKGKGYFCRKEKDMESVSGLEILLISIALIALLTGVVYMVRILNKEILSDTDMEKEIPYMKWQINILIVLSIINGTAILLLAMKQLSLS